MGGFARLSLAHIEGTHMRVSPFLRGGAFNTIILMYDIAVYSAFDTMILMYDVAIYRAFDTKI